MYTTFFWIGFIVMQLGGWADIVSSLGFEKYRTKSGKRMKEGNKALGGIWIDKDGNFAEKRAIVFHLAFSLIILGLFLWLPEYTLGLVMAGLFSGGLRFVVALGNWKNKRNIAEEMEKERLAEEQAAKVAAAKVALEPLSDAQTTFAAAKNERGELPLN